MVHAATMGISGRLAGVVHASPLPRHDEAIASFPGPHRPELGVVPAVLLATSDWMGVGGAHPHGSDGSCTPKKHAVDLRRVRGLDKFCLDFECVNISHKLIHFIDFTLL